MYLQLTRKANSRSVSSQTGQLVEWMIHGVVIL